MIFLFDTATQMENELFGCFLPPLVFHCQAPHLQENAAEAYLQLQSTSNSCEELAEARP